MPAPRPRRDVYGHLLPELAPAEREVLHDTETNARQRKQLLDAVSLLCREHLRRGQNVEIALRWIVVDGTIQEQIYDTVTRRWGGASTRRGSWETR